MLGGLGALQLQAEVLAGHVDAGQRLGTVGFRSGSVAVLSVTSLLLDQVRRNSGDRLFSAKDIDTYVRTRAIPLESVCAGTELLAFDGYLFLQPKRGFVGLSGKGSCCQKYGACEKRKADVYNFHGLLLCLFHRMRLQDTIRRPEKSLFVLCYLLDVFVTWLVLWGRVKIRETNPS